MDKFLKSLINPNIIDNALQKMKDYSANKSDNIHAILSINGLSNKKFALQISEKGFFFTNFYMDF